MQVAIHVADELIPAIDTLARRRCISRSRLISELLELFLERDESLITARLNEVYEEEPAVLDPILSQMQFTGLRRCPW